MTVPVPNLDFEPNQRLQESAARIIPKEYTDNPSGLKQRGEVAYNYRELLTETEREGSLLGEILSTAQFLAQRQQQQIDTFIEMKKCDSSLHDLSLGESSGLAESSYRELAYLQHYRTYLAGRFENCLNWEESSRTARVIDSTGEVLQRLLDTDLSAEAYANYGLQPCVMCGSQVGQQQTGLTAPDRLVVLCSACVTKPVRVCGNDRHTDTLQITRISLSDDRKRYRLDLEMGSRKLRTGWMPMQSRYVTEDDECLCQAIDWPILPPSSSIGSSVTRPPLPKTAATPPTPTVTSRDTSAAPDPLTLDL